MTALVMVNSLKFRIAFDSGSVRLRSRAPPRPPEQIADRSLLERLRIPVWILHREVSCTFDTVFRHPDLSERQRHAQPLLQLEHAGRRIIRAKHARRAAERIR